MSCNEKVAQENSSLLHIFYISGITVIGLSCLISLSIYIAAVKQLCNNAESVNKVYKFLTIACISTMTICSVGDFIHLTFRFLDFPNCNDFYHLEVMLMGCNDAIYFLGNILFYILLLLRIYNTFHINKIVTTILSFFIILFGLSSAGYIVLLIKYGINDLSQFFNYTKYDSMILSVTDFVLNVNFFIIFWCQLKKTVIDIDIQSNVYQNIANVLTKHIVLFGIAIVTNQLFFIWTIAYAWYNHPYDPMIFVCIDYVLRSIELSVNVAILWLVLNINYEKYLCCCKHCHLCVAKCCVKNNERPFQNPYMQLNSNFKSIDGVSAM